MPKYKLTTTVKAAGRVIKPDPDGKPVELSADEAKAAKDFLEEATATEKNSDSSGKGNPGSEDPGASSKGNDGSGEGKGGKKKGSKKKGSKKKAAKK